MKEAHDELNEVIEDEGPFDAAIVSLAPDSCQTNNIIGVQSRLRGADLSAHGTRAQEPH